jgi:hypothetical protein
MFQLKLGPGLSLFAMHIIVLKKVVLFIDIDLTHIVVPAMQSMQGITHICNAGLLGKVIPILYTPFCPCERTLTAGQDVVAASRRTPHGLQAPSCRYLTAGETTSVRLFVQNHVWYQSAYPLLFVQTLGVHPVNGPEESRDAFARWAALGKGSPDPAPWLSCSSRSDLPITHRSVVTAIDISISRQSPLVGRGFQGTPDLPFIGSWRVLQTNKSGAEQIWLLTYFAGHPSLISVSPSIIYLSTIYQKAS